MHALDIPAVDSISRRGSPPGADETQGSDLAGCCFSIGGCWAGGGVKSMDAGDSRDDEAGGHYSLAVPLAQAAAGLARKVIGLDWMAGRLHHGNHHGRVRLNSTKLLKQL